jgi:hypothetical protein
MRTALRRFLGIALVSLVAAPAAAQDWNSGRALNLARRAIERRAGQIADSSIASYSAKARGYLTFLGQLGDTAIWPAMVMKHTQLAVDVYWKAPNQSKQIVVGMRDTLLTPADIDYYSDRFGIVQSNFPDRIRMGDGRDVADVVHPFSLNGIASYDFAIVDSLTYDLPGDARIEVFQLQYRPKVPEAPRVMGSAMIDVRNADLVRLDLTFTQAAILDKRIEHLTVSLENTLIEGRAWLPRRQEIEVVRTGKKFRMEARGIIRGRWEIGDYDITFVPQPGIFSGRPIVFGGSRQELKTFPFTGGILDELPPETAILRSEDIKRIQREAEDLVAQAYREQSQKAAISVAQLGDIARIDRAEGVALGASFRLHPLPGLDVDFGGRYGFSDDEGKGGVSLAYVFKGGRAARAYAKRDYIDARDVPEGSGIRNSIAAQEFGSDYTDPVDVRAAGLELTLGRFAGFRWRIDGAVERHDGVAVAATPERGTYEPTIPASAIEGIRTSFRADGLSMDLAGGRLRGGTELRLLDFRARDSSRRKSRAVRLSLDFEFERRLASGLLATRTTGAMLSPGALPAQFFVYLGGPTTAPGYRFDDFDARRAFTQRVEWTTGVPFIPISLGRFGQVPPHANLTLFAHTVWADDPAVLPAGPGTRSFVRSGRRGWYPALGVGFSPLLGIVRFDIARGLRDGRWTFSFDLARSFWPIM